LTKTTYAHITYTINITTYAHITYTITITTYAHITYTITTSVELCHLQGVYTQMFKTQSSILHPSKNRCFIIVISAAEFKKM
jgi:hypothetical protein